MLNFTFHQQRYASHEATRISQGLDYEERQSFEAGSSS
jgi:hypothetical protein